MLSGYIFELYTCVRVQKCNKNMCIHTLAPGGRPRVSFFFAGGALPVYDVRNCTTDCSSQDIGTRGVPHKLYPPIYEITTFDVMVPADLPTDWKNLAFPEQLCRYGFPFFGGYFRDAPAANRALSPAVPVSKMAFFALNKLLF
jgi:hypothetical protein